MVPTNGRPSPAAEAARRNSEKAQLQEIREKFGNYIRNVRSMRNQLNQGNSTTTIQSLQEEVMTIRSLYEREVAELRKKLEQSRDNQSAVMASEYQSRLLEMSGELLKKDEQIQALQLAMAQQESSIQSLRGAAVTPSIQRDLARQELRELQGNLLMAQTKYEEEFSKRLELEDRLQELTIYTEDLKQIHRQETQDLQGQIAQSHGLVLQLEDQLRTMSRGGPAIMETMQRLQEASEAEVKRLQDETESAYNQNLLELQMRLNNDQILLGQAQEDNQRLHQRVEELTAEMTALEKKLFSEETNNRTLMEKLACEQMKSLQHIRALEARLEELQDLLLAKMKELSTFQETNISLRSELDALKSMLEEEEHLMSSNYMHLAQTPLTQSFPSSVSNVIPDYSEMAEVASPNISSYPTEQSTVASSEESSNNEEDIRKISEELPPDDKPDQTEELKRAQSAPPFIRQSPDLGDSQGSSASMMDTMNHRHTSRTPPLTSQDMRTAVSSAIGDLEISEVDPSGDFVGIINRSLEREEDIGGCLLQQNLQGHPVSVYRFPPKTRVMAGCSVTIWATSAGVAHNPPTDLLCQEQSKFVSELRCTTILCTSNGKALAWFTPLQSNMRKPQDKKMPELRAKPPSPIHTPEQPKEEPITGGKIQSPVSPPVPHTVRNRSTLLKREKIPPASLPVASSPWTQSPDSPTHPDFTPSRFVPLGRESNSLCRQSRPQTATSASSGVPRAGLRHESRKSRGPTRSHGPSSQGVLYLGYPSPSGSALHKLFANSSYNIRLASQGSLAPTTLSIY